MGTKIEYASNALAASAKRSRFSVDESAEHYCESQGVNHSFQLTGFENYQNSINMPDKHNIDFIRNTMQIHDDIFKQQVRELHRLYSVQKMLMEELKKKKKQNNKQYRLREDGEMSQTERSGSCSGDQIQTVKIQTKVTTGFNLERTAAAAAEEDVSTGVISRTEGPEEAEIELTLSIGSSSSSRRRKRFKKEAQEQPLTPATPISNSSATFEQQRKQHHSHWLFHGFTINRTSSSTG